jgi:hypothetical protein
MCSTVEICVLLLQYVFYDCNMCSTVAICVVQLQSTYEIIHASLLIQATYDRSYSTEDKDKVTVLSVLNYTTNMKMYGEWR